MFDSAVRDGFIDGLAIVFDHQIEHIENFDVGVNKFNELRVKGVFLGDSTQEIMDFRWEGLIQLDVFYQL